MNIRRGLLSDYFQGVAVKRLSAVEADSSRSNQHEYNGVEELKRLLGAGQRQTFQARFIWLGDEQEGISDEGDLTWYDARERHPTRSEYRLYFPATAVSAMAKEGDLLFLARRTDQTVLVVVTPGQGTIRNQLLWLFGMDEPPGASFDIQEISTARDAELDFAARYILDELGVDLEEPDADYLDSLIEHCGLMFPRMREFSELARASLPEVSALDSPDEAVLAWMEREEQLFRRLERHIVAERLRSGFMTDAEADVEGFLSFSLSVQNRRKARAGSALESHLEAVFLAHRVRFSRGAETENRNRPDFLFPGHTEYHTEDFPPALLTMLGAKSTLKERWRQVLSEAQRIEQKHLLTLEPGISENQTDEMRAKQLQLVVPAKIQSTFRPTQQAWLMSLENFIKFVLGKQMGGR